MVFDKYIQQYFNNIVALSFIGGGNRSTRRKPPTCHMKLTNYHIMLYRVHFPMGEIRTHTFNGKSNYHTITVTPRVFLSLIPVQLNDPHIAVMKSRNGRDASSIPRTCFSNAVLMLNVYFEEYILAILE